MFLNTPRFRALCNEQYVAGFESWRSRKGRAKVAKIDTSQAEDRVDFTRVKFMVKREVNAQIFGAQVTITKARGIQFAVNERSAYEYVEEFDAFSRALAIFSDREQVVDGVPFLSVYASKMSHADISAFATESERLRNRYPHSVIDERDGKNWDANIQRVHREAMCRLYGDCLGSRFADYVRSGIRVRGAFFPKGGGSVRYEVDGTVKSGHGDTSCGNGALNREISMQALRAVGPRFGLKRVRSLIMGDDYIAWLYFDRPVSWQELSRALTAEECVLGIQPVRGLFQDLRLASFISLGFYRAHDGQWVALPKVGRLFSRLFWTVTPMNGRDPRRLASGIAQSFYPLYSTWPPMREFLRHHMTVPPLGVEDCNHYYEWAEIGLRRLPAPINWAENHLVKYGMGSVLLDLEMPAVQGAGVAHHPVVDEMYRMDVADPADRPGCLTST